jgi:hypothetical protein
MKLLLNLRTIRFHHILCNMGTPKNIKSCDGCERAYNDALFSHDDSFYYITINNYRDKTRRIK